MRDMSAKTIGAIRTAGTPSKLPPNNMKKIEGMMLLCRGNKCGAIFWKKYANEAGANVLAVIMSPQSNPTII